MSSCYATTKPKEKPIEEITSWIGDKEAIKGFLDSPYAQANQWVIKALK